MSCTAWCKYICSYVRLHVKWWVIAGQSETGQRAALWHAPWAHTGGINYCLLLLYKSPDWCPWCCHMSEDEPTLSHWNRGKWRWCHSGPPFWLWCHQQNKSSRSCPQRCLLTSGKDGGGGRERERVAGKKMWYQENMVAVQRLGLHDSVGRTWWIHVSSLPSHYSGHCKKHGCQLFMDAFLVLNNFWGRSGKGCIHTIYVHLPHPVTPQV